MCGGGAAIEERPHHELMRGGHFLSRLLDDDGELRLGAKFPLGQFGEPLREADELLDDLFAAAGLHQLGGVRRGLEAQAQWHAQSASRWPHPAWGVARQGRQTTNQTK